MTANAGHQGRAKASEAPLSTVPCMAWFGVTSRTRAIGRVVATNRWSGTAAPEDGEYRYLRLLPSELPKEALVGVIACDINLRL